MSDALEKPTATMNKEDVLEFLKNNQDDTDLIEALLPKKQRPRRGQPADFQAYAIERLRNEKDEAIEISKDIVATSRANMNNQQRIHTAVLRLLEA